MQRDKRPFLVDGRLLTTVACPRTLGTHAVQVGISPDTASLILLLQIEELVEQLLYILTAKTVIPTFSGQEPE
jgi:hypothetical protein